LHEEIKQLPTFQIKEVTHIHNRGVSFESEVDLGTPQNACPEIGNYFRCVEKIIQPSDAKWDRRVLNDYRDYYIREDVKWQIKNTRSQTRSIQNSMHQKAVPVCLNQETMHKYHDVSLCHAGTDRCVIALCRH